MFSVFYLACPFPQGLPHAEQSQEHPQEQPQEHPLFRILMIRRSAKNTARAIRAISTISIILMVLTSQSNPNRRPISRTSRAAIQATAHCQSTTYSAHFRPSSRRTDATAATHGV